MVDSDEENDRDMDLEMNMTGFLFGNIDEDGQLEDDILDSEAKRHLASLGRLGLSSLLQEMIALDNEEQNEKENEKGENEDENKTRVKSESDDVNYLEKSPTALDFSDINELAEDINEDDAEASSKKQDRAASDYDADDEEGVNKSDTQLMPPPPIPDEKEALTPEEAEAARQRKLETPLASMLPSKYANINVTELFPDFRPNKVLRFSRLFGPGKPSSLPQIWRGVRKRRKKKKHHDPKDSDSGSDHDERKPKFKGWKMHYAPTPSPDECIPDDEEKLLLPVEDKEQTGKTGDMGDSNDMGPKVADWRFGPAQIWYDMLEVPETGDGFNYGFKLAEKTEEVCKSKDEDTFPDDSFLMVSQLHWEDDVVWNGDDIKHKVMQKLNSKNNAAGWVPSSSNRTAQAFSQPGKGTPVPVAPNVRLATSQIATPLHMQSKSKLASMGKGSQQQQREENYDDTWYSIFPVENEELVYGLWEEEVIWDAEHMTKIPKPKILTLDPNDENIVLGIPDDIDPALLHKDNGPQPKVKIPHPHVKKSKLLLGKAGVINVLEEDAPPPPPKSPDRDPFNISNDSYYMPRSSETTLRLKVGGGNLIQHSTPVVELRAPFVQTHMGPMRLRNFHRPPLKRYSHGPLSHTGPHHVLPLLKHIKKKAKQREQERIASGGGDVFFMRTPEDLTGRDGEIVLIEFSEEHPPLMNQVGMCSKVKNYYKRRAGKDQGPMRYKYGEVAYAHTSPFLGILTPGQSIQAIENNMYRAPIYEHNGPETDFLIIRTRQQYFVREIDALFIAGQECPLYEVPGPNSKRANNFVRDFLQVFIYRLFWKSRDTPRRIKMDDIKKAFPSHSESSIRKRLKLCADFKRTGMDSNWWVIKPDFRLPTEEEIRAMVSPEQCCAYFSMIAAEQRLKDAGYGEKFLFTPQDDDDEEMQLKMDDEVKVAPWNTTRAYIQAMRGKCLLQLAGPADPTGCGEGFSYVRVPNKPTISKEEQEAQPKRTVTGTDADLRRLSLNNAKALLRKFGVPEEEIKKLSRWEVIDVVRTLSTEKAKAGEEGMTKFSRGNRFSIAEHQERYKEECQRIFDLQNRVLSSNEVLSTDEGESSDEDSSDIEEMGKNIENMLSNKKTSTQLSLEREEQERHELRKMIMGDMQEQEKKSKEKKKDDEDDGPVNNYGPQQGRVLKIYRTFRNPDGKEFTRVELVRKPAVIDTYIKIRNSKDETFIKQFATLDEAQKEEMKREKRRIQEQLRRIKRNQERERMLGGPVTNSFSSSNLFERSNLSTPPVSSSSILPLSNFQSSTLSSKHPKPEISPSKRKKPKLKPDLKLKCGACGNVGHMRTNKACPLYQNSLPTAPVNVAMTEEQEEEIEKQLNTDDQDLVNVDGTKVKLSSKLIKHAEEMKRRTLLLKVPKEAVSARKRRRATGDDHCDYLKRQQRPANRRRTDPVVVMSTMLESILNEMRDLPDVQPFLFPVNAKVVPDYYKIVQRPMDLQTIRENLRQKKYQSRGEFLADVNQIVENSTLYNGVKSSLTVAAKRMLDTCVERLGEKEDRLMRLEKAINPLLDDNDQVALSFILDNVVNNKLKSMTEAWPFLKPVNKKMVKDYYNLIKRPMDLESISKKVTAHKYHSRHEFLMDIAQILKNCTLYNGKDSPFTQKAETLVKACKETLDEYDDHLTQLENNILLVQQRAMEQADIDSSWLGPDEENYTIAEPEFRGSQTSSPDNPFGKSMMDDFDFVDVEGDMDGELGRSGRAKKKDVLEEDLQFSSEDEFDEVPFGTDEQSEQTEMEALEVGEMREVGEVPADDDSQQAAEAMVQLSNVGFYTGEQQMLQQEESMDVDPNYDPSDFLLAGLPSREDKAVDKIQDDLAVSESDDEAQNNRLETKHEIEPQQEEDEGGDLWF
ncbi:transcription initiation factor TFIID subunit 1 [Neodiprion pinetum]|uniref:Transcription initiation factor TFIID subunit n=1 Tax=Neodiprion lecontei TaxID=441921 RepID=A0A6J0BSJ0_NEOLC|nr:transcription initiation factor TFIID subunit 1 [Neodiprion lecontei]XP_046467419.1 transcription initiation factor TFIID subunit 1 [Neodiprion pinetum]XP_046467420.1 transcription initiation factor TFIID subunit 1 [Neodiprion pinetum]XP_046587023.1 transcription initiation factor TFIID subunit 1 [Neodiprion lecontei]